MTAPAAGPWGLTRVAYACDSVDDIRDRVAIMALGNGAARHSPISSRRLPRRPLAGGSIFWIIRHMLVARQRIIGVDAAADERGALAIIRLGLEIVPVCPLPCRSHQGWRYIALPDWPVDLGTGQPRDGLPPALEAELAALSLV